jgi:phenylpropionate dioxygenase-like ring-hydroxylating dioxygenase large terminal subunit
MKSLRGSARSLVDVTNGEISREIFVNESIYQEEQERIFSRAWLYVGHESQIPKPGDFVISRMGEESVILCRDRSGKAHVFLNTCTHRGMKVCRYDEGNTKNFICPYHGWSFGTDGALVGVQDYDRAYQPPFDKSKWGLPEVAQMESLHGTVWATWDPKAPSLRDYLGDAWIGLDQGLRAWDGSDAGVELLGSPQKWIIPSNWKFVAENFSGDMLHAISHRSVDMVGIGPNGEKGRRDSPGRILAAAYPEGHAFFYGVKPHDEERSDYAASPVTQAYFRECWQRRLKNRPHDAGTNPLVGTVFPNMSFHAQQPRTILSAHPIGPNTTEMWRVYFVDKAAPEEVKRYLRSYYIRYSGPGGMTEQDDMENWNYASAASRGTIARKFPYHYKAGLRLGRPSEEVPGLVTEHPITTEQNPRALYKRWAEFMDADDWAELMRLVPVES